MTVSGQTLSLRPPRTLIGNALRSWVDTVTARILGYQVYSYEETFTGKISERNYPIYRKVVDFGALPNNTTTTVSLGISSATLGNYTLVNAIAAPGLGGAYPLPSYDIDTPNSSIEFKISGTDAVIETNADFSSFNGRIEVEYEKVPATQGPPSPRPR